MNNFIRAIVFTMIIWLAAGFTASAIPINFDPQDFEGSYAIRGKTNFRSGPSTIDLAPGFHQVNIGNGTDVPIVIDAAGQVTTTNTIALTTGNASVAFNTVPVVIDPRTYGQNTSGRWEVQFIYSGNAVSRPGPQTVNLVPNVAGYRMIIGNTFGFLFSLDPTGNVSADNPVSATGGFRTLDLNTVPVVIDPADYGQNQFARWEVQFTYTGVSPARPGPQTVHLVPGVVDYKMLVGDRLTFLFSVDDVGNVSVANPASAVGAFSNLTFNALPITIDPGDLDLNSVGDWGVRFINQVRSANDPGPKTVWLVPGGSQYGLVIGDVSPAFRFAVDDTGNVTVPNPVSATGGPSELTLNTVKITVDPDGYTSSWAIRFLTSVVGIQDVYLVPGINNYRISIFGSPLETFAIEDDGTPIPSLIPLTQGSEVYNFVLSPSQGTPIASAGPDQSADEGDTVSLDGSNSTHPDNAPLTFAWTQLAGPAVILSDVTSQMPSFSAPAVAANETVTFELIVSDGQEFSEPDTVNVTIKNTNSAPIADAGDDFAIKAGAAALLNGANSFDPDGDALAYQWQQVAGPVVVLSDMTASAPGFDAPALVGQDVVFKLSVSDGFEGSIPSPGANSAFDDTVMISTVANMAPNADAGPDQNRAEASVVTLNGGASSDPDGDMISPLWLQVSGPAVVLSDATSFSPDFAAPAIGPNGAALTFSLQVTDNDPINPLTAADEIVVTLANVNDPPSCDLATPSDASLWPPNHKLADVRIIGVEDPDTGLDGVTLNITGVTQDEPVNGTGDGDTGPDAVILSDGLDLDRVLLRSERDGGQNGRVYVIHFNATDGQEACEGSVHVSVPKKRKDSAIDDGQLFDSTQE